MIFSRVTRGYVTLRGFDSRNRLANHTYCIPRRSNRRTCCGSEAEGEEDKASASRFMMMIMPARTTRNNEMFKSSAFKSKAKRSHADRSSRCSYTNQKLHHRIRTKRLRQYPVIQFHEILTTYLCFRDHSHGNHICVRSESIKYQSVI